MLGPGVGVFFVTLKAEGKTEEEATDNLDTWWRRFRRLYRYPVISIVHTDPPRGPMGWLAHLHGLAFVKLDAFTKDAVPLFVNAHGAPTEWEYETDVRRDIESTWRQAGGTRIWCYPVDSIEGALRYAIKRAVTMPSTHRREWYDALKGKPLVRRSHVHSEGTAQLSMVRCPQQKDIEARLMVYLSDGTPQADSATKGRFNGHERSEAHKAIARLIEAGTIIRERATRGTTLRLAQCTPRAVSFDFDWSILLGE